MMTQNKYAIKEVLKLLPQLDKIEREWSDVLNRYDNFISEFIDELSLCPRATLEALLDERYWTVRVESIIKDEITSKGGKGWKQIKKNYWD